MLGTFRKKLQWQDLMGASDDPVTKKSTIRSVSHGDIITFGTMDLHDLSGKSCIVGTPTLYHFTTYQFQSFPLSSTKNMLICHMIIASKDSKTPYLALSRKISSLRKQEIFTEEDYARLMRGEIPYHLYAREHTGGMSDWLYMHYEVKIREAKGTSISPDNEVKAFNYGLYVSLKEQKALEIERYPSGDFDLYATVFCSANDIVALEPRGAVRAGNGAPKTAPHPVEIKESNVGKVISPDAYLSTLKEKVASSVVNDKKEASLKETSPPSVLDLPVAVATQAVSTLDVSESLASITPLKTLVRHEAIQCNLRMASKLIDEALRNDIRVSDVIRKALGLRVAEMDFIAFDLRLSKKDYALLADRFEVDVSDKEKIHQFIMEELSHFTGEAAE